MVNQNPNEAKEEIKEEAKETISNLELTPKQQEAQRKFFSAATLKELLEATKKTTKDIKNNPHLKDLIKEQINQFQMFGLALIEFIPGLELSNDAAKILSVVEKATKKGKKTGFFSKLYSHTPPGLTALFEGIDVATPIPAAEIWQMTANQLNIWKHGFLLTKDATSSAWKNFSQVFRPAPMVAQAAAQFKQ